MCIILFEELEVVRVGKGLGICPLSPHSAFSALKCAGKNMGVLLLSRFSCVWLFVMLWSAAHQAPLSWVSPGKNIGVGCHALLRGSSQPRDQTRVSHVYCTGSGFLTTRAIREAPLGKTCISQRVQAVQFSMPWRPVTICPDIRIIYLVVNITRRQLPYPTFDSLTNVCPASKLWSCCIYLNWLPFYIFLPALFDAREM